MYIVAFESNVWCFCVLCPCLIFMYLCLLCQVNVLCLQYICSGFFASHESIVCVVYVWFFYVLCPCPCSWVCSLLCLVFMNMWYVMFDALNVYVHEFVACHVLCSWVYSLLCLCLMLLCPCVVAICSFSRFDLKPSYSMEDGTKEGFSKTMKHDINSSFCFTIFGEFSCRCYFL